MNQENDSPFTEQNHKVMTLSIPFAFMVCHLLDCVAKLFRSWSAENLGTCSADVEGVWEPDSVSWWRRKKRLNDSDTDSLEQHLNNII